MLITLSFKTVSLVTIGLISNELLLSLPDGPGKGCERVKHRWLSARERDGHYEKRKKFDTPCEGVNVGSNLFYRDL